MAIGLEELVARLGSGIESTPDVCGGAPRIAGTGISVWALEQARRSGASEADLLRDYPGLRAADLVNAWTYAATHQDEIEAQIHESERKTVAATSPTNGWRGSDYVFSFSMTSKTKNIDCHMDLAIIQSTDRGAYNPRSTQPTVDV